MSRGSPTQLPYRDDKRSVACLLRDLHWCKQSNCKHCVGCFSPQRITMPSENTALLDSFSSPQLQPHSLFKSCYDACQTTLASSPINWLLLFVPLGILAEKLNLGPVAIFSTNFVAIIPLASLLAYATEELGESIHNDSIAGLLNATFGNAVEVIVSVIALRQNQITVVQASMLGSILSNLLLVLGSCFIVGGLRYKEQFFNQTAAQTMGSLLAVSVMALLLPAAFYLSLPKDTNHLDDKILDLSRGTSFVLLIVYVFYMVFQLKTHAYLFAEDGNNEDVIQDLEVQNNPTQSSDTSDPARFYGQDDNAAQANNGTAAIPEPNLLSPGAPSASHSRSNSSLINRPKSIYDLSMSPEQHLSAVSAIAVLFLSTILVSICADYLVGTIDEIVQTSGLSKTFIGLIIIPIVGNAAEHVTAIYVAYHNKMDLAIGVAIGSSLQIAIFVTPFLVLVGWFMDVPMSLYFSMYETAVIFVAVFITNSLILDGSSNWLEGVMLVSTYLIIGISFFLFPDTLAE